MNAQRRRPLSGHYRSESIATGGLGILCIGNLSCCFFSHQQLMGLSSTVLDFSSRACLLEPQEFVFICADLPSCSGTTKPFHHQATYSDMAHEQELKVEPNDGGLVNPNAVQGSEETESGPRTSPDNLESSTFDWKASSNTKLAFTSICILALMAALDGTSIGVALPVSKSQYEN